MLEQHGVETVDHSPKMRHFQAQHTQVIWKSKKRNPKANWFDTITVKQWEIIINNFFFNFFCDQLGNTLRAAPTYITEK